MLLGRLGAEANAFFYIAWQITAALSLIPVSIATSLFAEGCHDEKGLLDNVWRSLRLALAILAPVVTALLLFSGGLLHIFGGQYANNSTQLLRLLSLSLVPVAVNQVYFAVLRVQRRMRLLATLSGVAAAVTLGIAYPLLPSMGTLATAAGWLAGQSLVTLWVVLGQGRPRVIREKLAIMLRLRR